MYVYIYVIYIYIHTYIHTYIYIGFPFLGNDFFAECGDVFSCHVVDNPDPASELQLLRSYAPSVEAHLLDKFVAAFADLRGAVDGGKLAYPYSTRELVALARHLHAFPRDSPAATLDNVLAFDQHNSLAMSTLTRILHRHGIPLKSTVAAAQGVGAVRLSREHQLPPAELVAQWHAQGQVLKARISRHVLKASTYELTTELNVPAEDPVRHRLYTFSECLASWIISEAHGRALDCAATPDGAVHVLVSPLAIHSYYGPDYTSYSRTDLLRRLGLRSRQILENKKSVDCDFCWSHTHTYVGFARALPFQQLLSCLIHAYDMYVSSSSSFARALPVQQLLSCLNPLYTGAATCAGWHVSSSSHDMHVSSSSYPL